jgi:hypothetical protein
MLSNHHLLHSITSFSHGYVEISHAELFRVESDDKVVLICALICLASSLYVHRRCQDCAMVKAVNR